MKKFCIATLAIILTFALTACGRRNTAPAQTVPATQTPVTEPMIPTIDPTMGTNIPDPDVDTTMPDLTEPSEQTRESNGATTGIGENDNNSQRNGGQ